MPRAPAVRRSQRQRPGPYELRSTSHNMATQLVSPYPQQYPTWEHNQQSPYDQHHMLPMNHMYNMATELQPSYEIPTQPSHQSHHKRPSQSVPWTAQEDDLLLEGKRKGLQWEAISKKYFHDKTGNACRKRYERLEHKRRGTDWDEARLERLAVAYKEMRQQIWAPLAARLQERSWEHVEKKCMEEGPKNLANKASYHIRHPSSGSSRSHRSAYDHEHSSPQDDYGAEDQPEDEDEDSGIGLGLGSENRRESRSNHHGSTLDPGILHNVLQAPMYLNDREGALRGH